MPTANLANTASTIDTSKDSIIIVDNFRSKRGGATLDTTGFTDTQISAGHIIIQETSTGNYKPMPVSSGNYAALPTGHTYAGILIATISTAKPFAGIMFGGTVNPVPCTYVPSSAVQTAVQTALPNIVFKAD
jgi:hypothetical protein